MLTRGSARARSRHHYTCRPARPHTAQKPAATDEIDATRATHHPRRLLANQPPPRMPTRLPDAQTAHVAATTTRADQDPRASLKHQLPPTIQGPPDTPENSSTPNRRRATPHAYHRLNLRMQPPPPHVPTSTPHTAQRQAATDEIDATRATHHPRRLLANQPPPHMPTRLREAQTAHVAATTARADQDPNAPLKHRLPPTLQGPLTTPEDSLTTNRRRTSPHAYHRLNLRT